MVLLEIICCFLLQKKVGKSYIKTFRWLRPNLEVKPKPKCNREDEEIRGKYRTVLEV